MKSEGRVSALLKSVPTAALMENVPQLQLSSRHTENPPNKNSSLLFEVKDVP